jgi:hypothetical protein
VTCEVKRSPQGAGAIDFGDSCPKDNAPSRKTIALTKSSLELHLEVFESGAGEEEDRRQESERIAKLQKAAEELGFTLPELELRCEKPELNEWLDDQQAQRYR